MAKKRKNANYVTDKRMAAQAKREEVLRKEQKAKKLKNVILCVSIPVAIAALVLGILLGTGAFDYRPEATHHASIAVENYGTLHVELYGEDAPETVEHFIELAEDGYFDGKSLHTLLDGLLYGGSTEADGGKNGIKGEFSANGYNNKVPFNKGTVAMSRGESNDSAYGQFFILTKNNAALKGDYAAFGRVTELDVLDSILADYDVSNPPKITSVSLHAAHH